MIKQILTIVFISFSLLSYAQSGRSNYKSNDALERIKHKEVDGKVSIWLDSLVEENYNKHLVQNKKQSGVRGYRIRIFSDNGYGAKENQRRARAQFLSLFPDIPTYYPYEGSYYKIYVGDFRTKRDALKELEKIRKEFPDAFIVEDNIIIED